jgi:perosamine synthetase|tara:strand:- start:37 stop:1137 length:1101 start_codon:yes stop_codon:yes gene_type:complete
VKNTHLIPWASPKLFGTELKLLKKALQSSWISGGKYIGIFEEKIKKKLIVKNALLVNNGTSAIHAAYIALGLKAGDKIIIPMYGYMASANIAKMMGLKIIFADVELDTFCISLRTIKKILEKNVKAIVVISTYGNMPNIEEISKFAKKKKIYLIEDAAESLGSKYKNKFSGAWGDIGTFSFHATKSITSGEGGAIVTRNRKFAEKISLFRNHGIRIKSYVHIIPGHNFRMSNMLAAFGLAQFNKINIIFKERLKLLKWYRTYLEKEKIIFQKILNSTYFMPWTIGLILKDCHNNMAKRDKIILKLKKLGIETKYGFKKPEYFKVKNYKKNFKNSYCLTNSVIALPFHLNLKESQVKYICKNLNKLL